MSEVTLHKRTTKLTETKTFGRKEFKLLMRYMHLALELSNGCYFR